MPIKFSKDVFISIWGFHTIWNGRCRRRNSLLRTKTFRFLGDRLRQNQDFQFVDYDTAGSADVDNSLDLNAHNISLCFHQQRLEKIKPGMFQFQAGLVDWLNFNIESVQRANERNKLTPHNDFSSFLCKLSATGSVFHFSHFPEYFWAGGFCDSCLYAKLVATFWRWFENSETGFSWFACYAYRGILGNCG